MITLLLHLLRLFPFLFGGHRQLALENLAQRQQLAVYKRTATRPPLRRVDRLFWIGLARVWAGWRQPLVIVTPDTVLRWQRRRVREYWTKLSAPKSGTVGARDSRRQLRHPPVTSLTRWVRLTHTDSRGSEVQASGRPLARSSGMLREETHVDHA